jgi:hypothetical protein
MQTILDVFKEFQNKNIWWAPEQFQDIQDTRIRDGVRKAYRIPSEYLTTLITKGTVEDMTAFETALDEQVGIMKTAALAGLLDLLYKHDQSHTVVSEEVIQWYRQKKWNFPLFTFEQTKLETIDQETDPKKIDTMQEASDETPAR